jgi:polyferredoxin
LVRANIYEIAIIVLANILIAWLVFTSVEKVNVEQDRDIFMMGATILGISTVTLVLFGDYMQKTTRWLFEKTSALAEFREAIPRMGKVLLRLVFLQLLLWWSVVSTGGATLLAIMTIYGTGFAPVGVVALALLLSAILTITFWMSLFVLLNTPGRITYRVLSST